MRKIIIFMVLLALLMAFGVQAQASITLVTTTWNSGTLINFSVKTANDGSLVNISNLAVFASSSSTRNSTSFLVYNISNTTATNGDLGYLNFTLGPNIHSQLENAIDFTVTTKTTGVGDSDAVTSTTSNVFIVANTVAAPTSITFSNPIEDTNTITATIVRANANQCYIRFGSPSAPRTSMTLSGTTCTYTASRDNPPNGAYQSYFEAFDGNTAVLSAMQNVEINIVKSDGGSLFYGTQLKLPQTGDSSNPFAPQSKLKTLLSNPIVIIAIVLIGIGLYNKK